MKYKNMCIDLEKKVSEEKSKAHNLGIKIKEVIY